MSRLIDFTIPFKGLKQGKHELEFEISDRFFSEFDGSEVTKGNLMANVLLDKNSTFLKLDVHISGNAEVVCDRCLDTFYIPVEYTGNLFVKFSEREAYEDSDDDVLFLPPSESELDLKQYLFDWICLSLPVRRVHPDDKNGKSLCNPEMIEKLEAYVISEEPQAAAEDDQEEWKKKLNELKSNIKDN
ncbi:MAG TPA: DUF177 domain-containing protein [Williamwhitmania sp.]|nr:DUF177 domain-containing protein [Williamwhitmania sp.]